MLNGYICFYALVVYYTKSRGKLPSQEVDGNDGMECFMDGSDGCGGNAGRILHGTADYEE